MIFLYFCILIYTYEPAKCFKHENLKWETAYQSSDANREHSAEKAISQSTADYSETTSETNPYWYGEFIEPSIVSAFRMKIKLNSNTLNFSTVYILVWEHEPRVPSNIVMSETCHASVVLCNKEVIVSSSCYNKGKYLAVVTQDSNLSLRVYGNFKVTGTKDLVLGISHSEYTVSDYADIRHTPSDGCFRSSRGNNPFWTVDLGNEYMIVNIKFKVIQQGNYTIYIYTNHFKKFSTVCGYYVGNLGVNQPIAIDCFDLGSELKLLRAYKSGSFQFCSLEVYHHDASGVAIDLIGKNLLLAELKYMNMIMNELWDRVENICYLSNYILNNPLYVIDLQFKYTVMKVNLTLLPTYNATQLTLSITKNFYHVMPSRHCNTLELPTRNRDVEAFCMDTGRYFYAAVNGIGHVICGIKLFAKTGRAYDDSPAYLRDYEIVSLPKDELTEDKYLFTPCQQDSTRNKWFSTLENTKPIISVFLGGYVFVSRIIVGMKKYFPFKLFISEKQVKPLKYLGVLCGSFDNTWFTDKSFNELVSPYVTVSCNSMGLFLTFDAPSKEKIKLEFCGLKIFGKPKSLIHPDYVMEFHPTNSDEALRGGCTSIENTGRWIVDLMKQVTVSKVIFHMRHENYRNVHIYFRNIHLSVSKDRKTVRSADPCAIFKRPAKFSEVITMMCKKHGRFVSIAKAIHAPDEDQFYVCKVRIYTFEIFKIILIKNLQVYNQSVSCSLQPCRPCSSVIETNTLVHVDLVHSYPVYRIEIWPNIFLSDKIKSLSVYISNYKSLLADLNARDKCGDYIGPMKKPHVMVFYCMNNRIDTNFVILAGNGFLLICRMMVYYKNTNPASVSERPSLVFDRKPYKDVYWHDTGLKVIKKSFEKNCLKEATPFMIDLGKNYRVAYVEVGLPEKGKIVYMTLSTDGSYNEKNVCGFYDGPDLGKTSVVIYCGRKSGAYGRYIHLHNKNKGSITLCNFKLFVKKVKKEGIGKDRILLNSIRLDPDKVETSSSKAFLAFSSSCRRWFEDGSKKPQWKIDTELFYLINMVTFKIVYVSGSKNYFVYVSLNNTSSTKCTQIERGTYFSMVCGITGRFIRIEAQSGSILRLCNVNIYGKLLTIRRQSIQAGPDLHFLKQGYIALCDSPQYVKTIDPRTKEIMLTLDQFYLIAIVDIVSSQYGNLEIDNCDKISEKSMTKDWFILKSYCGSSSRESLTIKLLAPDLKICKLEMFGKRERPSSSSSFVSVKKYSQNNGNAKAVNFWTQIEYKPYVSFDLLILKKLVSVEFSLNVKQYPGRLQKVMLLVSNTPLLNKVAYDEFLCDEIYVILMKQFNTKNVNYERVKMICNKLTRFVTVMLNNKWSDALHVGHVDIKVESSSPNYADERFYPIPSFAQQSSNLASKFAQNAFTSTESSTTSELYPMWTLDMFHDYRVDYITVKSAVSSKLALLLSPYTLLFSEPELRKYSYIYACGFNEAGILKTITLPCHRTGRFLSVMTLNIHSNDILQLSDMKLYGEAATIDGVNKMDMGIHFILPVLITYVEMTVTDVNISTVIVEVENQLCSNVSLTVGNPVTIRVYCELFGTNVTINPAIDNRTVYWRHSLNETKKQAPSFKNYMTETFPTDYWVEFVEVHFESMSGTQNNVSVTAALDNNGTEVVCGSGSTWNTWIVIYCQTYARTVKAWSANRNVISILKPRLYENPTYKIHLDKMNFPKSSQSMALALGSNCSSYYESPNDVRHEWKIDLSMPYEINFYKYELRNSKSVNIVSELVAFIPGGINVAQENYYLFAHHAVEYFKNFQHGRRIFFLNPSRIGQQFVIEIQLESAVVLELCGLELFGVPYYDHQLIVDSTHALFLPLSEQKHPGRCAVLECEVNFAAHTVGRDEENPQWRLDLNSVCIVFFIFVRQSDSISADYQSVAVQHSDMQMCNTYISSAAFKKYICMKMGRYIVISASGTSISLCSFRLSGVLVEEFDLNPDPSMSDPNNLFTFLPQNSWNPTGNCVAMYFASKLFAPQKLLIKFSEHTVVAFVVLKLKYPYVNQQIQITIRTSGRWNSCTSSYVQVNENYPLSFDCMVVSRLVKETDLINILMKDNFYLAICDMRIYESLHMKYKPIFPKKIWHEAEIFCDLQLMQYPIIESNLDQYLLEKQLKAYGIPESSVAWLGGSKIDNLEDFVWNNKLPVSKRFPNWGMDRRVYSSSQNCIGYRSEHVFGEAYSCLEDHYVVCQSRSSHGLISVH